MSHAGSDESRRFTKSVPNERRLAKGETMTQVTEDHTGESMFEVPPPDRELRRLKPLLGTWEAEEHTRDSVLGPGVPVRSTERFYWLEGRYFLVQHYETAFGDEPPQKGVNYWFYDADAGKFRIIFFSNNGPFTADGNRY
jgi:hypothetical protein